MALWTEFRLCFHIIFTLTAWEWNTMLGNRSLVTDTCFLNKCMVQIEDSISEDEYFWFDVTYWSCAAVMVVVGIPVNYGLVHYERFGEDPQKRSLTNRVISSSVISNIMAGYLVHTFTAMLRLSFFWAIKHISDFVTYQKLINRNEQLKAKLYLLWKKSNWSVLWIWTTRSQRVSLALFYIAKDQQIFTNFSRYFFVIILRINTFQQAQCGHYRIQNSIFQTLRSSCLLNVHFSQLEHHHQICSSLCLEAGDGNKWRFGQPMP